MITGIVLAAGTSSRLGRPKQLLDLGGKPVLQHVIDSVSAAGIDEVIVVLGHRAADIAAALDLTGVRICHSLDYESGLGASLQAGLACVAAGSQAAAIVLGDQPGLDPATIRTVVDAFVERDLRIARASFGGVPGHPVVLARTEWSRAGELKGDQGMSALFEQAPGLVESIETGRPAPPDIDTWADYERVVRGPSR